MSPVPHRELKATVILPTHEHSALLPLALRSVQSQTVQELEIFIVGDGVRDSGRKSITRLAKADDRIRFFDYPKAPRQGEANRQVALREARGSIVCYQSDDDLWLPEHVATC